MARPTSLVLAHEDSRGCMRPGRFRRAGIGGRTSLPRRLSRSVADSVGPAGAEFHTDRRNGAAREGQGKHSASRPYCRFGRVAMAILIRAARCPDCAVMGWAASDGQARPDAAEPRS
jgi:hypothetical protein